MIERKYKLIVKHYNLLLCMQAGDGKSEDQILKALRTWLQFRSCLIY